MTQMQQDPFADQHSSIAFQTNPSEYNFSLNNSVYETSVHRIMDSDSEEDEEIKKYHQLLLDNYSEDAKSQALSQYQGYNQQDLEKKSAKSVKSRQSTGSIKTNQSHQNYKSFQNLNTFSQDTNVQFTRNKRKYLRQESRRIKNQLKQEQLRQKRQKKQFRDIDLAIDGKRKRNGSSLKSKRRKLTKRTLELLAKKFDEFYASQHNNQYKGPKISIKDIGMLFEIGNSTIHKLYVQWMEDPSFYERINQQSLKEKTPERKLTLERLEHVARLIKQNPFMTQNQLTVELNKIDELKVKKHGEFVEITRTTVARLLKVGKFKKKRVKCVPKERNTAKSLQKRFDYCSKYKEICMKQAKIYFLDESGFNLYMTRDKAWARPNEEITVNCPISKGKRFSLIAIIAQDGLTHWRIIEGTYRKYEYLDFVRQLFIRLRQQMDELTEEQKNDQENMRQKWLILDNCAIHDKQQTVKLAKECEMQILYLPPYSPQLNPIENWFSEVKSKIRKINYTGEKQLLDIMHRTLKDYENHDFSNYFRGILKHVEKGINKERF